jgi:two-component system phosphate regulon sensor histidine kinase PhoR
VKLGVSARLFVISLALLTMVGVAASIVLETQVRELLFQHVRVELSAHAQMLRQAVEDEGPMSTATASAERLRGLGLAANAEVALVAADAPSVGEERYIAVRSAPVTVEGQPHIVEVRRNRASVEASLLRFRVMLGVVGLMGLLLATVMTYIATQSLSRAFREVVDKARALLTHRLARQMDREGEDALGVLSYSLDRLAEETERLVGALAAERDRMNSILDGMNDGVVAFDQHGRIELMNRAARALLHAPGARVGMLLVECVQTPRVLELADAALVGPPRTEEVEVSGQPERVLTVHSERLPAVRGGLLVLWDVTALKHLERVRRDFVANVSHELRTPVCVVRANAELLLDTVLAEPGPPRNLGEAILRNADRMGRLVGDLLTLSRLEAGKYLLQPVPCAVDQVVNEAQTSVEPLAQQKRIQITTHIPAQLTVLADERSLEHVLVNLLDNAVKYGRPGGSIEVRAVRWGQHVRVEVADDGPGIAPQHRARVFERFYRTDSGRSRDAGGTGLGLSIVRHLVESMSGRVGVESAEPRGSVFWFELPLPKDTLDSEARAAESAAELVAGGASSPLESAVGRLDG